METKHETNECLFRISVFDVDLCDVCDSLPGRGTSHESRGVYKHEPRPQGRPIFCPGPILCSDVTARVCVL